MVSSLGIKGEMWVNYRIKYVKQYFHIPILVIGIILTAVWVMILYHETAASREERLHHLGELQLMKIEQCVNRYIHISEWMAEYVVKQGGDIDGFENWALPFFTMHRSLRSLQLAPDGVVSEVYPATINKEAFGNIKEGPYGRHADMARKKHQAIVEMIYPLRTGGKGMLFLYPVYTFSDHGGEHFWGYSIVTVDAKSFLEEANLSSLKTMGISYDLSWKGFEHKNGKELHGDESLPSSVVKLSKTIQGDTWTIRLGYVSDWENRGLILFALWGGLLSSFVVSFLVAKNRKLKHISRIDFLTGTFNRKGGDEEAAKYLDSQPTKKYMVMALDIDNFKFLNDVYGHEAGDMALKNLVQDIHHHFGDPMILTRNGGDEFIIMKPYEEEPAMYEQIRFFSVMPHRFYYKEKPIDFYTSIGCASYPQQDKDYKKLCVKADFALYNAKLNGKAGWRKYDDSLLDLQERVQLGFKLSDITDNIPGAILVYKAEPEARILFASGSLIRMVGCKSWEEFMVYAQESYKNIVMPSDWVKLTKERERMKKDTSKSNEVVFISYRIKAKNGEEKHVIGAGQYAVNAFHGGIFYVSLFDKDHLTFLEKNQ